MHLSAFCDINPERARKAAENFGDAEAKCYTDYRQLLKDPEIDSVFVLTWNPTHCEIAVAALEAGKNTLCEKPMALTGAQAQRMLDAARTSGKVLTVGYQHRYDHDVRYVKRLVEENELGYVHFAKARVLWRRALPIWRNLVKSEQGGGCLIDIGTHALDAVLWMMNNYEPKYVCATKYMGIVGRPECGNRLGAWKEGSIDVEDSGFAFLVMKNGATIILETCYALNTSDETTSIQYLRSGTKAGADNFGETLKITSDQFNVLHTYWPELSRGGATGSVTYDDSLGLTTVDYETRNFFNAIDGGCELTVKPEQALVIAVILDGIYASADSGKPFYFE